MAFGSAGAGSAQEATCDSTKRVVVALYDGTREPEARLSRLHRYAEMPLNHLGYRLIYHDVTTGSGGAEALAARLGGHPIAATVSWFDTALADPAAFVGWADAFRDACGDRPKAVILGHSGLPEAEDGPAAWSAYLAQAGITSEGGEATLGVTARITHRDTILDGAESDIVLMPGAYADVDARNGARRLLAAGTEAVSVDLAVIADTGAYAHDAALVAEDSRGGTFWRLDPFAFFAAALEQDVQPVPDTTTHNGRRIFFSTIRGDGWTDPLPGGTFGAETELAAEVVVQRFVEPYPELPVTVAIVTGDLDPARSRADGAVERGRSAVERLAALPQADLGTMGHSLIYRWGAFAPGGQRSVRQRAAPDGVGYIPSAVRLLGETASGARSGTGLDRRHDDSPFALDAEIDGAVARVVRLSRRDAVPLLLWSGDARPFAAALAQAEAQGAPAMGGEGGRLDWLAPSLTSLGPLTAPVDDRVQVLDALASQGSHDEAPPRPGFLGLGLTLERTERPRRLKPFHLNYTARAALTFGGRMAVERHLNHAREAELIPIEAREYVAIVEGWQRFRAVPEGDLVWRIEDRGALQTIRFDGAAALALDTERSAGVLGARRAGEALYVALDPAVDRARVALAPGTAPSGLSAMPEAPMLAEGRVDVAGMSRDGCVTHVRLSRVFSGHVAWWVQPGGTVTAILSRDGTVLSENVAVADDQGAAQVPLPDLSGGDAELRLTAACSRG